MDKSIIKGLNDKVYEKRKTTALELEKLVKQCLVDNDYARIDKIISELCRDYAYALHQPMARNAGLMGLAATAIALGSNDVSKYLRNILPPVLACFGDQNDQVRFYACESLYNIAKISKGEILVYFNEIFDVLCKVSADTENSVRGAAELLDRLIKDIVAERASSYISVVSNNPDDVPQATNVDPLTGNVYQNNFEQNDELAFSLPKFIPLLIERIYAINPTTRMFLVDWIKVLLNAPGLELISFLPSFLGGLLTFLGDSHKDVRVATQSLLDLLLKEVVRISTLQNDIQKRIEEKMGLLKERNISMKKEDGTIIAERKKSLMNAFGTEQKVEPISIESSGTSIAKETLESSLGDISDINQLRDGEEYIPGQDINLNFPDIISILVNNLASSEPEIQLLTLSWMDAILGLSSDDFIPFLSKILSLLLKLLSSTDLHISEISHILNEKLLVLCSDYDESKSNDLIAYGSIVNSLTLKFFDSDVEAKVACLDWLILIYRKAPTEILEHNDSMFLTLLKSLSNNDIRLIERALNLLQNLCSKANDKYLRKFLENFLNLLKKDPKLLKLRANYIMRKICASLTPERVYKVLASILNAQEDVIFTRMIIQILSTNLLTAPEMSMLRRKLRQSEDIMFFNLLFKSWCPNPVSVIALCFIAENYELVYAILQIYSNHDIKLNDLVQLDILIQFFELPVFTRMRLQLLEQQKFPFLYKSLYGILMMLPQSKAYDILNKRLTSVNVWANQSFPNTTFYKPRVTSASGSISDPDISQRSVGQSKLHCQELMDHFDKVVGTEDLFDAEYISANNSQLPILGTFLDSADVDNESSLPNIGQIILSNNDNMDVPNDASSVIEHSLTHDASTTLSSRNMS
ncbi:similar to Saccharomyces cerevisiae YLR386W VAC14 Protein involved in regulated synthesis of PtdIns(3,5)P(2) [Maudiozyma saulgeensis]|uniref:Similar to Saccharomyces cerevisiae YLR386W VAC14 Protein involved in regulated synthesis of PtdIns(3,5)P(2) n=1 Tax=Maudiozyma saulgeensis TaxID=1789683 RepID=A0A1X7RAP7_9SACH|nr:similar to Saccharomyces cerevisiae YLR386W VAC14 Protein involved in regulated synthesis of PtdIns(3,5)P(2) [Kazachstania saulgeensis]